MESISVKQLVPDHHQRSQKYFPSAYQTDTGPFDYIKKAVKSYGRKLLENSLLDLRGDNFRIKY